VDHKKNYAMFDINILEQPRFAVFVHFVTFLLNEN